MKAFAIILLLVHVLAQQEPQQNDGILLPDSMPDGDKYAGDPMMPAEAPIHAQQVDEPMPIPNQDISLSDQASSQGQVPSPSDPHPILKDLLSSVGVDNIGPDQPGGYGSGITAPDAVGDTRSDNENVVDQVLDQQKQQIQQHQAEKAAKEDASPQQPAQVNPDAQSPLQQAQPAGRSMMSDPSTGLVNNNPINANMPGPGTLPNANSAFGIPPIPPIADFTLPPTPEAPKEVASSKDQAKDSSTNQATIAPSPTEDDSARATQAVVIASSVGGAVLFGILAGVGLMWLRHKRNQLSSGLSTPV